MRIRERLNHWAGSAARRPPGDAARETTVAGSVSALAKSAHWDSGSSWSDNCQPVATRLVVAPGQTSNAGVHFDLERRGKRAEGRNPPDRERVGVSHWLPDSDKRKIPLALIKIPAISGPHRTCPTRSRRRIAATGRCEMGKFASARLATRLAGSYTGDPAMWMVLRVGSPQNSPRLACKSRLLIVCRP